MHKHAPFALDEPRTAAVLEALVAQANDEATPEQEAALETLETSARVTLADVSIDGYEVGEFDPEVDELATIERLVNNTLTTLWDAGILTGPGDEPPTLAIGNDGYYQWQATLGKTGHGHVGLTSSWSEPLYLLHRDETEAIATGVPALLPVLKEAVSDLNRALADLDAYIADLTPKQAPPGHLTVSVAGSPVAVVKIPPMGDALNVGDPTLVTIDNEDGRMVVGVDVTSHGLDVGSWDDDDEWTLHSGHLYPLPRRIASRLKGA